MREQKHRVDRTGGDKSGDQHGVHRGLQNRPRSMNETRVKSPKVCFLADLYLVYGIRRDSRCHFSLWACWLSPDQRPDDDEVRATAMAERSIKAMIAPKDIAALAVFLASDAANRSAAKCC
jgi:hypothetical protein